jgi:ribonuclease-3
MKVAADHQPGAGQPDTTELLRVLDAGLSPELLERALTHRSYAYENGGLPTNERLEFLGDSVLNCAVASLLYERFPHLAEGDLSRLRANLVNQDTLSRIAMSLELGGQLRLGEGELKSGGFRRPSILADSLEAVVGAIFLDGGFDRVANVIGSIYAPLLEELDSGAPGKDPKTLLQEHLQGRRLPLPQYNVVSVGGEAHAQQFQVECVVADLGIRTLGEGSSRRSAEQTAARRAYELAVNR